MKLHFKQFLLSGAIVVVFTVYIVLQNHESDDVPNITTITNTTTNTVKTTNTANVNKVGNNTNRNMMMMGGQYKDGTYTGSRANAYYGIVQVRATIVGGKITDVTFLSYPNDQPNSVVVSNRAMGPLKQETIQTQSAPVNAVSGATYTSMAFNESLANALTQAK